MTPAEITTAIAEGRVHLVPAGPSDAMLPCLCNCDTRLAEDLQHGPTEAIYTAMLSASPIDSKEYAAHVAEMEADARRLDWFAEQEGTNIVSDDAGKWAVSSTGFQPVPPEDGFTEDAMISSLVSPNEWRTTIREAIDAAIASNGGQ